MSYHEHTDHQYARHIRAGAPAAFKAFMAWDAEVLRGSNNVIPAKYTELMAVAVALTTQCAYCIEAHTKAAHSAGGDRHDRRGPACGRQLRTRVHGHEVLRPGRQERHTVS
ncbi:carboxymuconolactone decarboxylase family protein [Streptomyces sp. MI02-2A]|uniref:carboxymuconolactone decarboxylase family protein n=1 Tax=unclassified Streptomyces TaxID=2593676 RepID=UPI000E387AFD|nr:MULTISPECIES: carboxymuconolactone decarboxylase family protein [unclassified Streptomyces]MDX3259985.1 carboxymuconolactone decarboxylase family protein [Streptomyces sp. MI02-2A]REE64244.1 AhpD family alkylhydroperoxidase [Streptomyces sp. 3212.3]